MSKKGSAVDNEAKERIAAQLVSASEGLISVPQAMKLAKFPTPDRKNSTLIKRVYRKSKNLVVVDQKSRASDATSKSASVVPPAELIGGTNVAADGHSVSSLSEPPSGQSRTTINSVPAEDVNSVKRTLAPPTHEGVKRRRTSKQKHQDDADKKRRQNNEKAAIKMATREIDFRTRQGEKVSQRFVVDRINKHMSSNVSTKTTSQMVREGRIGVSPLKKGPVGDFPKAIWSQMEIAFVSFLKLEQANSKKQSTLTDVGH